MYQRAIGYDYDAVKIINANGTPMIVPYRATMHPDTTAMIFWLKNRRPDRWRDVRKHEHGGVNAFDEMTTMSFVSTSPRKLRLSDIYDRSTNGRGNGTKH